MLLYLYDHKFGYLQSDIIYRAESALFVYDCFWKILLEDILCYDICLTEFADCELTDSTFSAYNTHIDLIILEAITIVDKSRWEE